MQIYLKIQFSECEIEISFFHLNYVSEVIVLKQGRDNANLLSTKVLHKREIFALADIIEILSYKGSVLFYHLHQ
jgi:hypothetical protein